MKKILLLTSLLIGLSTSAQEFEWQWGKRGGGTKQSAGESDSAYNYDSEQIIDIAVDADNNYYFLAFIAQQNTQYDGNAITVYNADNLTAGYTDVLLISTDCEGDLRWTQTIGGSDRDFAQKIVLDNNGGLYIGVNVMNNSGPLPNTYLPPHFSPDDSMPVLGDNTGAPQEGYKMAALLKYNTSDGDLEWRVMPQGDVTQALRWASINQVILDSEGTIHTLIGFYAGTHLNGEITVPDTFTNKYKYYIVKYDSEGDFISASPLSLEGKLIENYTDFRYDENLDRYYLAGFRNFGGNDPLVSLSFNSTAFVEQAYILAFTAAGSELWRKEVSAVSMFKDNRFYDIEIDADSNLFVSGKYLVDVNNPGVSMNGYEFPMDAYLSGNVMYIMKLNSEGAVQWIRTPSGYTTNIGFFTGSHFGYDLVLNGDEIGVATQVSNEIWGDISITRPANHRSDAAIMRLNKATGAPIAVHDIMAIGGYDDAISAIMVDNDGNYVAGGYFHYNLFTADDDNVPTVNKVFEQAAYTDFFVTKLATGPCGSIVGTKDFEQSKINIYPNPATGIVNIQTEEQLNSYQVINMIGQVVLKGNLQQSEKAISLDSLVAGTYIINFTTIDGMVISQKIIKE